MSPGPVLANITDAILHLHGWAALALVFAVPALEASAFVGFVFPGEIAVILGGVLAFEHRISLPAAIGAAVGGAVVGDSIGYLIGRLWGRRLLRGTLGRLPVIRHHLEGSLDRAQAFVRRRRGSAVFFGRFTAALRVLVPGLAGMSEIHFPTFLAFNAAGGILWGSGFVLIGYLAGEGWRHVEGVAGRAGLILLGLVVIGLVAGRLVRHADRVHLFADRLAATRPLTGAAGGCERGSAVTPARPSPQVTPPRVSRSSRPRRSSSGEAVRSSQRPGCGWGPPQSSWRWGLPAYTWVLIGSPMSWAVGRWAGPGSPLSWG